MTNRLTYRAYGEKGNTMPEKHRYRVCNSSEYMLDPIIPDWIYFSAYSDEEACATAIRLTGQDLNAVLLQTYDDDFGFWDNALIY